MSFEEVIAVLESGDVLDVLEHPNKDKYPNQKIYVVDLGGYVYLVPFVIDKDKVFLKTIFPSRKAQKKYLG